MKALLNIALLITVTLSINTQANELFVKIATVEKATRTYSSQKTDVYTTNTSEVGKINYVKIKDVFVPTELDSKLKEIRNNRPIMFSKVDGKAIFSSTKRNYYYKIINNVPSKLNVTRKGQFIEIEGDKYSLTHGRLYLQKNT